MRFLSNYYCQGTFLACWENFSKSVSIETEIRLYSPFPDWFGTQTLFQINRCMVNTIWFGFASMRFLSNYYCRGTFLACWENKTKSYSIKTESDCIHHLTMGTANGHCVRLLFQINRCMVNTIWFGFDWIQWIKKKLQKTYTRRNLIEIALNHISNLQFSYWFGTKRTRPFALPDQSENGRYNLIWVWFNAISKRFLRVYDERFAFLGSIMSVPPIGDIPANITALSYWGHPCKHDSTIVLRASPRASQNSSMVSRGLRHHRTPVWYRGV